jgi:hypothetical protein
LNHGLGTELGEWLDSTGNLESEMEVIGERSIDQSLLAKLPPGEMPRFGIRLDHFKLLKNWEYPTAIVTESALFVLNEGTFKVKVVYRVPLSQIRNVAWGLWMGGGPQLALHLQTTQDVFSPEMIIRNPFEGEQFGMRLRSVLAI